MWMIYIDDMHSLRTVVSKLINKLHPDVRVESTSMVEDAVEMIFQSDEVPRLIMLDWTLIGRSGEDFLKTLRSVEKFANVPVIVLTAVTEVDWDELKLKYKIDDVWFKPNISFVGDIRSLEKYFT